MSRMLASSGVRQPFAEVACAARGHEVLPGVLAAARPGSTWSMLRSANRRAARTVLALVRVAEHHVLPRQPDRRAPHAVVPAEVEDAAAHLSEPPTTGRPSSFSRTGKLRHAERIVEIADLVDGEGGPAEEQQKSATRRRDLHRLEEAVHHEDREIERLGPTLVAEPRKTVAEIELLVRRAPGTVATPSGTLGSVATKAPVNIRRCTATFLLDLCHCRVADRARRRALSRQGIASNPRRPPCRSSGCAPEPGRRGPGVPRRRSARIAFDRAPYSLRRVHVEGRSSPGSSRRGGEAGRMTEQREGVGPERATGAEPPAGSPWDDPIESAPLVFLDLEMTGLRPESDRVIEVCAERTRGMRARTRSRRSCGPSRACSATRTCTASIRGSSRARPRSPSSAIASTRSRRARCSVAHAAAWDVAFLEAEFARAGRARRLPCYLDTLVLSRRAFALPSHNLASLCKELGVHRERAHRAEDDVHALRAVFRKIVEVLAPRTPRDLWHVRIGERHARPRAGGSGGARGPSMPPPCA